MVKILSRDGLQRMVGGKPAANAAGTGGGGGGSSVEYAAQAGHAMEADHAISADTATEATHATSADSATVAANLANDSTDWQKIARKDIGQTIAEVWAFAKGIVSTLRSYFNGGATITKAQGDTGNALVVTGGTQTDTMDASGNASVGGTLGVTGNTTLGGTLDVTGNTALGGTLGVTGNTMLDGTLGVTGKLTGKTADFTDVTMDNLGASSDRVEKIWADDIDAKDISTENLNVTKEAHFTKLVVDELLSNKGAIILSSANCVIEAVSEESTYYEVYFSTEDADGNTVSNSWRTGDMALCLTFKAEGAGTFNDVKNRYYWRMVTVANDVTIDDVTYHAIRLSKVSGEYDGSTEPEAGDNIVQLGYMGNDANYRQSAIILSAYPTMDAGVTPPSLAFYKGINDFSLSSHRYTFIDGLSNEFFGAFKIWVNNSWTNITTFFATADGLAAEITNRQNADGQLSNRVTANANGLTAEVTNRQNADALLSVKSDAINMFVTNGFINYITDPMAIDATLQTYSSEQTVDDATMGPCRQISYAQEMDWQLLHTIDASYGELTGEQVTWFCYVKPSGSGSLCFGSGYESSQSGYQNRAVHMSANNYGVVTVDTGLYNPDGYDYFSGVGYGEKALDGGWYLCWATAKLCTGRSIIEGSNILGFNSMSGTWTIFYGGIVKGTGCPSVETIMQGAGLRKAGINISQGNVNLIAGKVNFVDPNGDPYQTPMVSIDPMTGALTAVDGNFSGVVRASVLYRSYKRINVYSGMAGMTGSVLTLDDYLYDIGEPLPDVMFLYSSMSGGCTVKIPPAYSCQGKMIEIIGMHDWTGFSQVNVYAQDANMVDAVGGGSDIGIGFNTSQSSYNGTGSVRLLSAQSGSTWKWYILEWNNVDLI